MKNLFVLILLILTVATKVFSQQGKLQGRIYDENTNEPLPFTNIIIYGTKVGSISDLDGKYIFTGLEPGYIRLAVSSVGYETKISEEVLITNSKIAFIDIGMKQTSLQVKEITIKATPFKISKESPVSLRTLSIGEIEKNPGGNRDISKVLQSLPGVASTPAFRNDVIVRGGGASENRFFLDGIEIPNINHFSTQGSSGGPVGIINVDFIREIDFYSGAFPANYGNSLSSVLDMKQIDGNKDKMGFKGSFGASDLSLTLNGPIDKKTTFIFSARRSYLQFLFNVIGLPFLPTYNDYQIKTKTIFNEKNQLTIISLGALDKFRLNTGIINPDETQSYILGYLPVNEQWNYTIGANYKHFNSKSFDNFILSRNMLNNVSYKYFNNDESSESNLLLNYKSQEIENKFRYENTRNTKGYKINFGLGIEQSKYNNKTDQKIFIRDTLIRLVYSSDIQLIKWSTFGQISKSYIENKLSLSLGIRMDANSYSREMSNLLNQFSPRFSASYLLSDKLSVSFNTGRFYQPPAYTTMGFRNNINELVNKNNGLKYISADHIVAGLTFFPDEQSKISFEGFYKSYQDYPFSVNDSVAIASKGADFGTYGDEEVIPVGKGRAYGTEVLYQDKDLLGFNVLLSYTFVRSEFKNAFDVYIPSAWDNKHLLNITVLKKIKGNWDFGLKWKYVGGAPYTPYDLEKSSIISAWDARGRGYLDYSEFNTLRFKAFHQLDIRIDKEFFFNKWSLITYMDVQNVYNFKAEQQNFLTNKDQYGVVQNDPINPEKYILRSLPSLAGTVLPTLGIIVEF